MLPALPGSTAGVGETRREPLHALYMHDNCVARFYFRAMRMRTQCKRLFFNQSTRYIPFEHMYRFNLLEVPYTTN